MAEAHPWEPRLPLTRVKVSWSVCLVGRSKLNQVEGVQEVGKR